MHPLTRQQKAALDFVKKYRDEEGIAPTLQEIADAMEIDRVSAFEHVQQLQCKGYITRTRKQRSIEVLNSPTIQLARWVMENVTDPIARGLAKQIVA